MLKVNRVGNGKFDLLMHYPGWNSRYDSWISHNEVLKDDEKNREFMARANAEYDRANASKAKKASAVVGGAPSLKRKVDVRVVCGVWGRERARRPPCILLARG